MNNEISTTNKIEGHTDTALTTEISGSILFVDDEENIRREGLSGTAALGLIQA